MKIIYLRRVHIKILILIFYTFAFTFRCPAQHFTRFDSLYNEYGEALDLGDYNRLKGVSTEFIKESLRQYPDSSQVVPIALYLLGKYYHVIGNDSSIYFYEQSCRLFNSKYIDKELKKFYINSSYELGTCYYEIHEYKKALDYIKIARDIYISLFPNKNEYYIYILEDLIKAYESNLEFESAEFYYQELYSLYKNNKNISLSRLFYLCNKIGAFYYTLGNIQKALFYYLEAFELLKHPIIYSEINYFTISNNIGSMYLELGDYANAKYFLDNAIETSKILSDKERGTVYVNYGNYLLKSGKYNNAIMYFNMALDIQKYIYGEVSIEYSNALFSLSGAYLELSEYTKALDILFEQLKILEKISQPLFKELSMCHNAIGNVYLSMGLYNKAKPFLTRAIKYYDELGLKESINYINCYGDLGRAYLNNGEFEKALEIFIEVSDYFQETNGEYISYYIEALINLGDAYKGRRLFEKSEEILRKAHEFSRDKIGTKDLQYFRTCFSLGSLYYEMEEYDSGERYLLLALEILEYRFGKDHHDYIRTLSILAKIYLKKGEIDKAANYAIMVNELIWQEMERFFPILNFEEKVIYLSKRASAFDLIFSVNSHRRSDSLASVVSYNNAILRKNLFVFNRKGIRELIFDNGGVEYLSLYEEWRNLVKLINKQYSFKIFDRKHDIDSLEIRRRQLEVKISRIAEDLAPGFSKPSFSFEDVRGKLGEEEVAVEFINYYDLVDNVIRYDAIIVGKNSPHPTYVRLCTDVDFIQLYDKVIDGYSFDPLELEKGYYKLIWEPLESIVCEYKTIFFSPAGIIYSIPLQSIVIPRSESFKNDLGEKIHLVYLLDKYDLRRLNSTRDIGKVKNDQILIKEKSIVLFGGIDYDNIDQYEFDTTYVDPNKTFMFLRSTDTIANINLGRVAYLEGTLIEAQNILSITRSNEFDASMYTGINATEDAFKQLSGNSPSIIHIATHGFTFLKLNANAEITSNKKYGHIYSETDNALLRTGLMMAGANYSWTGSREKIINNTGEDGILTAAEILSMDLTNTELVVLSACETGLGDIDKEGIRGLIDAFKVAGVDNLIVSVREVDDESTQELMTHFYNDLVKSRDPKNSFKVALLKMQRKYPYRPDLWSAFVFIQ